MLRDANTLEGGQYFQPPQLMVGINRDGHFLLTEAVAKKPPRKNQLTVADTLKYPPRLIVIIRGGHLKTTALVNN
jgi:hypothetical protein